MINNIDEKDILKIRKILSKIQIDMDKINNILSKQGDVLNDKSSIESHTEQEYIEGIYDGRFMKATDGQIYLVPENYASKTKLVAGDKLKLIFGSDGKYIFKQIEAVERVRKIGKLIQTGQNYKVEIDLKMYNVLKASVTYYKIKPGSKVAVILPENMETTWATIENKVI